MEAKNSQNKENVFPTDSSSNNSKSKEDNIMTADKPYSWMSPPKSIINMTEFLETVKSYGHRIKEDGLFTDF